VGYPQACQCLASELVVEGVVLLLVVPNQEILPLGILLQADLLLLYLHWVLLVLLCIGCFGLIGIFGLDVLCLVGWVDWIGLLGVTLC
jgi:hypothetical protein